LLCGDKNGQNLPVKNWELVADKLSKSGWSLGLETVALGNDLIRNTKSGLANIDAGVDLISDE